MTIDLETLPTTTVLIKRAAALNVNLTMFDMLTQGGMRKEVSKRSVALWKSQKDMRVRTDRVAQDGGEGESSSSKR